MEEGVCEVCGERTVAGVQFCTSCGAYLGWRDPADRDAPPGRPAEVRATAPLTPAAPLTPVTPRTPATPVIPAPSVEQAASSARDDPPVKSRPSTIVTGRTCPRCATSNDRDRRFCRKCGQVLAASSGSEPIARVAVPSQRSWWQRWFGLRPSPEDRRARADYRKSLPVWLRLRRVLSGVVLVLVVFGFLRVVGRDPIGWAKHQLNTLRGTLTPVSGVTATPDPATAIVPQFTADQAVDGSPETAWATTLPGGTKATGAPCAETGQQGALQLTAPKRITLRAIKVLGGLSTNDPDRLAQWRPKTLDLGFSDASCQRVQLKDDPGVQLVKLRTVATNVVRVSVVAGYLPQGGSPSRLTSISEIQLMTRPD